MTLLSVALALLVPWACGVLWLRGDAGPDKPGTWPAVLGYGLLLGLLGTAGLVRLWGMAGGPLDFRALLAVLAGLGVAGALWGGRWRWPAAGSNGVPRWRWPVWLLLGGLLALLLLRWAGLAAEVVWRPMYPWDAWVNWAPRAKLWFGLHQMLPILDPQAWLAARSADAYTLPKHAYPAAVPTLQLWLALALGRWDPSLVNLPWLLVPPALGLATYGQLRRWGVTALPACLSVYLLLSLPMLNIHTALAGYADVWMGACYGLAAMAFFLWARDRGRADLAVFIVLGLLGVTLKRPGIVWLLTFLPALAVLRWGWKAVALVALAGTAGLLAVALFGLHFTFPGLGELQLSLHRVTVPLLLNRAILWNPAQGIFLMNLFVLPQWHLFWYLAGGALLLTVLRRSHQPLLAVRLALLAACFVFLLGVFFLTRLAHGPDDYTTINRALLHIVPATLFIVVTLLAPGKDPP